MTATNLVVLRVDGDRTASAERRADGTVQPIRGVPERAAAAFDHLVDRFPGMHLAWHDVSVEDQLTPPDEWPRLLRHGREIRHSAWLHRHDPIRVSLGAADFVSPFQLPASPDRPFATWLISPLAGIATTDQLRGCGHHLPGLSFAAWLLVLGHRALQCGAILWSEPRLAVDAKATTPLALPRGDAALVVRHTAGRRFLALWLGDRLGQGQIPLVAVARAALARAGRWEASPPPSLEPGPPRYANPAEVDVVIATLDRRAQLGDVLRDLSAQSHPVRRVVVVEQVLAGQADPGPLDPGAVPFEFVYHRLSEPGACNARNVALAGCTAEWVLLADDDMRFDRDVVESLLEVATQLAVEVVVAGVRIGTSEDTSSPSVPGARDWPHMWPAFGAGNSLARRTLFDEAGGFDRRLDGGFGEDYEWAVRARAHGAMVVSAPAVRSLHLKAPTGGLRTPHPHPWRDQGAPPRPSPTVILSRRLAETSSMHRGWVMHYWARRLLSKWSVGPITMRRQWKAANEWADRLEDSQTSQAAVALEP